MPLPKSAAFMLVLAGAVSLSACHSKPEKSDDQRTAEGEVYSATVSDAMLPTEAPTSTPPAEPKLDAGDRATEKATSDADELRNAMDALSADKSAAPADAGKPAAAAQ
ncbi:MAG: hypothetical protein KGJ57_02070 [Sphingomonadales bacterium]|nr:hypothetical protein [Sphingomonadales bacterium]MDE2168197.1 hypothetical protein [Sphingomonadales bacterium]